MNKEKALKNQGLEFREDIIVFGGYYGLGKVSLDEKKSGKMQWEKVKR